MKELREDVSDMCAIIDACLMHVFWDEVVARSNHVRQLVFVDR